MQTRSASQKQGIGIAIAERPSEIMANKTTGETTYHEKSNCK